jgi:site-specific recombinase XerD
MGERPKMVVTRTAGTVAGRTRARKSQLLVHGGVELLSEAQAAVRKLQGESVSASTRRGYSSDWKTFAAWCDREGCEPKPAAPATVAMYLAYAWNTVDTAGDRLYSPSTLARWLSSINTAHTLSGYAKPGAHPDVSRTMAGIRNGRTEPVHQKRPLLLGDLRRTLIEMDVNSWPHGVIGHRDRALLLMGFAGAFRRSELASLQLRDVVVHSEDGLHVKLRRSKTDQEGLGTIKGMPYGANPVTCPPCAHARWIRVLAAAEAGRPSVMAAVRDSNPAVHICREPLPLLHGSDKDRVPGETESEEQTRIGLLPLFRPVMKNGSIASRHISGNVVNDVVKRRVAVVGLPAPAFGGHSLRAGFVTQALRAGATHHEVMRQTGHADPATVEIYSRETDPLRHNAVTRLGL